MINNLYVKNIQIIDDTFNLYSDYYKQYSELNSTTESVNKKVSPYLELGKSGKWVIGAGNFLITCENNSLKSKDIGIFVPDPELIKNGIWAQFPLYTNDKDGYIKGVLFNNGGLLAIEYGFRIGSMVMMPSADAAQPHRKGTTYYEEHNIRSSNPNVF